MAVSVQAVDQCITVDARDGLFTGRIDIGHYHMIGVVEALAELGLAGDIGDRLDGHARRLQVKDEETDPGLALGIRIGTGQQEHVVGVLCQ
jgi:hypothetical protein